MSDKSLQQVLRASTHDLHDEIQRLKAILEGKKQQRTLDPLVAHFWLQKGSTVTSRPRTASEQEAARTAAASQLRYAQNMGTFTSHMQELEQRLHEEALKIGTHAEAAIRPDAPSRCPSGKKETIRLTELQRAAQRFFEPGCPPPMRRIMVELTPGMGKTCVYLEVISKFLGKRNPETGAFFDIIILGDDEVFSAFNKLRDCPARVNIEEIVQWNEDVTGAGLDRQVLYKRDDPTKPFPSSNLIDKKYLPLKAVNPGDGPLCSLNTTLHRPAAAAVRPKTKGNAPKPKAPPKAKETPLEERKNPNQCSEDAWLWRGTRVIMIPYATAAKWVVFSGKGVPLWDERHSRIASSKAAEKGAYVKLTEPHSPKFKDDATKALFHEDFKFFTAKELGTGPGGLQGSLREGNSIYRPEGLDFASSNSLFIVDEVQNLSMPSQWGKGQEARPYSPALSEALWRCTGDFCDERDGPPCLDGVQKTPYIFAGTATPNTGTNPESTICLLQILNGKQRAHLFVPRWAEGSEDETDYAKLKPRTLAEYRRLLHSSDNRSTKRLVWPPYAERKAENLVVLPRSFLEADAGFVEDVTRGHSSAAPFPLLQPQTSRGRVLSWKFDKRRYSYGEAARKVLAEKLLPAATEDVSHLGAYRPHEVKSGGDKLLMHELAYKSFICAAREEDLHFQATRIYRPVYRDELNRLFLQDMVATRVFTANSYYDYRLYPQVEPTTMQGDLAQPLTRIVVPKYALRCLPRKETESGFEPDLSAVVKLAPRMEAERRFPSAELRGEGGVVQLQYPWFVPKDSAETFLRHLKRNRHAPGPLADCRWAEWSLCADLKAMKQLCARLYDGYRTDPHSVDLALEDELRDFCARNCPKLVAAADDMYNSPPPETTGGNGMDIFAPGLAAESKTFFFMNAAQRKELNSNYFIVLGSFYLRMRCRPFLQARLKDHLKELPALYRDGTVTIQHRLAWLDALLLEGGADAAVKAFPPYNVHGVPTFKAPPDAHRWEDFWVDWMQGHRAARGVRSPPAPAPTPHAKAKRAKRTPKSATAAPKKAAKKTAPPLSAAATRFHVQQLARRQRAAEAKRALKQERQEPPEERDAAKLQALKQAARSTFFRRYQRQHGERRRAARAKARNAFYVPAIFALGDSDMDVFQEQTLHHRLYCAFTKKLAQSNKKVPAEWAEHRDGCKSVPEALGIEELVALMGSSGLRGAMTRALNAEPCVRSSSAGQSMVLAGLAAHKALDFKCTGLNVAFGPQPRGQRIQEMGRNWRTCVNLPYVAIRQIFLDGEDDVLKNDLLLDSFYAAQNEVLDWLRTITVSAGLGCSLWWGYSQWAKLLSSYHEMRPEETEWFFGAGKSPCLDARGSSGKPSLLTWHQQRREHETEAGFFRCRRTDVTSVARLHESGKDVGEIVPSPVGAFSPEEIVFDPSEAHEAVVPDPSCRRGSAVELRSPESASVKYCLTPRQAERLRPRSPRAPKPLRLEHFLGPSRERSPHSQHHLVRTLTGPTPDVGAVLSRPSAAAAKGPDVGRVLSGPSAGPPPHQTVGAVLAPPPKVAAPDVAGALSAPAPLSSRSVGSILARGAALLPDVGAVFAKRAAPAPASPTSPSAGAASDEEEVQRVLRAARDVQARVRARMQERKKA